MDSAFYIVVLFLFPFFPFSPLLVTSNCTLLCSSSPPLPPSAPPPAISPSRLLSFALSLPYPLFGIFFFQDTRSTLQNICRCLGKTLEPEEVNLVLKNSPFLVMKEKQDIQLLSPTQLAFRWEEGITYSKRPMKTALLQKAAEYAQGILVLRVGH